MFILSSYSSWLILILLIHACVQSLLVLLEGTDEIYGQSNHVCASSCVFKMFKKIEKPEAREMRSVISFLKARNMKPPDIHRQLCEVYGEHDMSDGWDTLMKDAKMCMMIRGAADRLWLMKIWCVQWREDSREQTIRHFVTFPAISTNFTSSSSRNCVW
jgi:hypothetical protein